MIELPHRMKYPPEGPCVDSERERGGERGMKRNIETERDGGRAHRPDPACERASLRKKGAVAWPRPVANTLVTLTLTLALARMLSLSVCLSFSLSHSLSLSQTGVRRVGVRRHALGDLEWRDGPYAPTPDTSIPKPETRTPKPAARNLNPETRNPRCVIP